MEAVRFVVVHILFSYLINSIHSACLWHVSMCISRVMSSWRRCLLEDVLSIEYGLVLEPFTRNDDGMSSLEPSFEVKP